MWRTEADEDVFEAVSITGMGHGVPLAARGVERCGNAGPFHFDVGISSSHHILRFWGLAGSFVAAEREAAMLARPLVPAEAESYEISALGARESAWSGTERDESSQGGWQRHDPRPVIEAALKAAGLLSEAGAQRVRAIRSIHVKSSRERCVPWGC